MYKLRIVQILLVMVGFSLTGITEGAGKKLRVYILAGQSNMVGYARKSLLERQVTDSRFKDFWAPYRDGDNWVKRDDVFITFFKKRGPLSISYGDRSSTGPELGFGRVLGDHFNEPVLLIKTAWGGHSLYKNFRSPSSMPDEEALKAVLEKAKIKAKAKNWDEPTMEKIKESYGPSYRKMLAEVQRVLNEKDALFPALKGTTPEISGFFWFQGYNDQFGDNAPNAYESNMKHFIKDVRQDLKAPNMPFVIAGIGTFGYNGKLKPGKGSGTGKVLEGQLAMNNVPEFKGNVKAFETAPLYDKEAGRVYTSKGEGKAEAWKMVGSNKPYHYLGSGIWYSRIGQTAGELMIELHGK